MADYTITLSEEQEKALKSDMLSIQDWIDNSIQNKARQMIDFHVEASGLGNRNTAVDKKLEIITGMTIETAVERQAREEQGKEQT